MVHDGRNLFNRLWEISPFELTVLVLLAKLVASCTNTRRKSLVSLTKWHLLMPLSPNKN